jgi:phospholipid/cholesterol/gamma-HCH transport system permease protein
MANGFLVVGRRALNFIARFGSAFILLLRSLYYFKDIPRSSNLIVEQCFFIGNKSLSLAVIASLFVGAVSAWQAAYQFKFIGAPLRYLGAAVGKAVVIELAPVLTALVIAGRVGAGIAAEIGTMKVTEQIDALESMAISPIRYLIMPRILASVIMIPLLTIFAAFVAIGGGLIVSVLFVDISHETFLSGVKNSFQIADLASGLVKSAVFGLAIGLVGCHEGFRAEGGARGVGKATTEAVVIAAVMILVADYLIATILFKV